MLCRRHTEKLLPRLPDLFNAKQDVSPPACSRGPGGVAGNRRVSDGAKPGVAVLVVLGLALVRPVVFSAAGGGYPCHARGGALLYWSKKLSTGGRGLEED